MQGGLLMLDEEIRQEASDEKIALGESPERLKYLKEEHLKEQQLVEPEVVENKFKSPFGGRIGKSSVDLVIPGNNDKMLQEYSTWWKTSRDDPQREILREAFNQKYYGMSTEDFNTAKQDLFMREGGFYPGANNWGESMKNNFQALSIKGLAWSDFVMDSVGTLGGPLGSKLDDKWDKATMIGNPTYQTIRKVLSVVLPSIQTGRFTERTLQNAGVQNMPFVKRSLTRLGAWTLESGVITALSDTSEDDNLVRTLSEVIPGIFGPEGAVPLPEGWKTTDAMSPLAKKKYAMWENSALPFLSVITGATLEMLSGAKKMGWFIPKSKPAVQYKQLELSKVTDPDKLIEIQKIDELLSTGGLSRQNEQILINKKMQLEEGLDYVDDVDEAMRLSDEIADNESIEAGRRKLQSDESIEGIDPDITPGVLDSNKGARSIPREGTVARNIADTTAIKNGTSKGDPAPIITEAMRSKGLMVGPGGRPAVMGLAESTREIGRFDAVVDGFRFSAKQMNAAAWDIYTSIVDPGSSLDDVKALFLENRDVKNMLLGRFKVEHINDAMRDLVDRFLGREVSEASARAMDTLGREAATLADTIKEMAPYVDDNRAMDLIIEKMEFLMDEYALNKYISGWSLRNKNWFDQVPPKELDTVIDQLTKEFTSAENAIHAKNMRFTKTLKELKKNNPLAMRPLVDAFAHTNGDVDSLAKLYKFAEDAVTPWGAIKSPNPKQMNLFAQGLWSSNMNNALSGLSPVRAMGSAVYMLTVKPITHGLGTGFWSLATKDFDNFQRVAYYYGAVWDTNTRALTDAWQMMKKAHKDPEMMIKAYRKDFRLKASKEWDIASDVRELWKQEGNVGKAIQYDMAKWLTDISKKPGLRYGMSALVFPDAYTNTVMATYISKMKAYDDVFSEFGFADWEKIKIAQKKHYDSLFDSDGLIKDDVLRAMAGEVQLNLDDGVANWINEATTAYPITKYMFMFPRTGSNYIKNSASWTPISAIPGVSKYSKTIYAKTDDQIIQALKEHGVDINKEANWKIIWQNLRDEYTGRIMFSSGIVFSLFQYAMAGNIRGNGHYSASRRNKERDQLGYEPKTIKVPIPGGGPENDIWISYRGIPGLEQVLGIIGDMSYYASDLNEPMLQSIGAKLAWTLAASFADSPLQGFQPLMEILSGNGRAAIQAASKAVGTTFIPRSSAMAALARGINSAQKEIAGHMHEYLMNRIPLVRALLPNRWDIWTDEALNDVNEPWRKVANTFNPYKVSATLPWWKKVLFDIRWDGMSKLTVSSDGSYKYTPRQLEAMGKLIAAQKPVNDLIKILNKPKNKKIIEDLKLHRSKNWYNFNKRVELDHTLLPIFQEIDAMLDLKKRIAEIRLEEMYPEIAEGRLKQIIADQRMREGDIQGAVKMQQTEQLIKMSK